MKEKFGRRTAVISGASSGIGLAAAQALSAHGYTVYDLSRRPAADSPAVHIPTDVCSDEAVGDAVTQVLAREGRIDLAVCCAGCGISGAAEFIPDEEARRLTEVNQLGAFRLARHVIGPMRQGGGGKLLFISSVAALCPIPYQAHYSATKAALIAFAEALRAEVRPFGIEVCSILPGDIRTGFTAARHKITEGGDIYSGRVERSVARMERDEKNGMPPEAAAKVIVRLAARRRLPPQITVGAAYKCVAVLTQLLPRAAAAAIIAKIYG